MLKRSFKEKMEAVFQAIVKQLKSEGTQTEGLEDQIGRIAKGYMLVEQCLWYRLTDDKALTNLLVKFEAVTTKALPLIDKHGFENLVFTFRSTYTNLYQVSGGKGRTYQLSSKVYDEFINKVDSGELKVLTKVNKAKPKASNPQKVVNNFMSTMLQGSLAGVTTKVVNVSKVVKPTTKVVDTPKVVVPKTTTKVVEKVVLKPNIKDVAKGNWVKVYDLNDKMTVIKDVAPTTFIKVVDGDGAKVFGKFHQYLGGKNHEFEVNTSKGTLKLNMGIVNCIHKYVKGSQNTTTKVVVEPKVETTTTKVVDKKKTAKPTTKVVESKVESKVVEDKWVAHDIQKSLPSNTFIKVLLKDNSEVMGRYQYTKYIDKVTTVVLNVKKALYEVDITNISKVYTYQK